MLIMLIICRLTDPPSSLGVPISPQMINMINISPVLATFWKIKKLINMINMINISPILATFWKIKKLINMINMINISPVLSTSSPKCA